MPVPWYHGECGHIPLCPSVCLFLSLNHTFTPPHSITHHLLPQTSTSGRKCVDTTPSWQIARWGPDRWDSDVLGKHRLSTVSRGRSRLGGNRSSCRRCSSQRFRSCFRMCYPSAIASAYPHRPCHLLGEAGHSFVMRNVRKQQHTTSSFQPTRRKGGHPGGPKIAEVTTLLQVVVCTFIKPAKYRSKHRLFDSPNLRLLGSDFLERCNRNRKKKS